MAKSHKFSAALLFAIGTFLMSMAWLMQSFPVFAFFGLAPFMAIVSGQKKQASHWNSLELILLGLGVSFFCATFFALDRLIGVIFLAMMFSLPFLGVSFRRSLGQGAGLLAIVLFWLALEYAGLKIAPEHTIFLSDLMRLKPDWVRWNASTGYLGASLWILLCNALLFKAWFADVKFNWMFLFLFAIAVISPIVYSYTLAGSAVEKAQMIQFYQNDMEGLSLAYMKRGEWIPRTAAWVSVLMLLYSFVMKKTARK